MQEEQKVCQNCKTQFTIESEDFDFYNKIGVPPPTWCPDCRLERRLIFRNERALYRRPCEMCGASTVSMYDPASGIHNYCGSCWWSDRWDPMSYAQEYDFSRPFFVQFGELMRNVPQQNLSVSYQTLTNSDFTNMNHELKNCYYLFNSDYDENCLYSEEVEHSKDCVDVTMIESTQLAYESLNCNKCYNIYFSVACESSHDVWFSKNLVGCSSCFGCIDLRNKQYCIWNEQYTKDEYQKKIEELKLGSHAAIEALKKQAAAFWLKFPEKYMHGLQNFNATGDYIYNSKYVKKSYIVLESEYCKYCTWLIVKNNKECYDFTQFGENTQKIYEALICGKNISDFIGCVGCLEGRDVRYSMGCRNNNLFGCLGLRKKQYCILNRQYTKEEYEALIPKIIEHMNTMPYIDKKGRTYVYGDFFPPEISQFSYNETSAQEFFPLTKDIAEGKGYSWKEPKEKNYQITITPDTLPDDIKEVKDDITSQVIGCAHQGTCNEQCATAFRIIPQELQFYRAANLPLPRLCPNCRHYERVKQRNPNKLWQRTCECAGVQSEQGVYKNTALHFHGAGRCPNEFETSYAPERPERVYCEQCYQAEVV